MQTSKSWPCILAEKLKNIDLEERETFGTYTLEGPKGSNILWNQMKLRKIKAGFQISLGTSSQAFSRLKIWYWGFSWSEIIILNHLAEIATSKEKLERQSRLKLLGTKRLTLGFEDQLYLLTPRLDLVPLSALVWRDTFPMAWYLPNYCIRGRKKRSPQVQLEEDTLEVSCTTCPFW